MATVNDVWNLLNGNPPYPGDAPSDYATIVDGIANLQSGIVSISDLIGIWTDPTFNTLFKVIGQILDELIDPIEVDIGTPVTGESVFDDLRTLIAGVGATNGQVAHIGTAFTDSGTGFNVYPTPNAHNIAEDFVNTRTAVAVINTVNTLLSARLGAGGAALGNLLQNAAAQFLSNSGVQVNLNANLALAAGGMVPPITSLTVQAFAPIVNQRVDSIPAGAYGCRIDLTVPSTWGQIDNWPFYYVPPVARLDYARSGYYGFNPIGIQTDFILAYPFPPWADSMVVSLGVGVTAERAWLVL